MASWLSRWNSKNGEEPSPTLRDYAAEEKSYATITESAPWDWEAQIGLGDALLRQEKFREAARAYSAAAEARPDSAAAWGGIAKALCYLGNFEGAKEYLDKGIAIDSADTSVMVAEGLIAYKDQNLKRARQLFERASTRTPNDVDAYFHLGQVLWELGKMGPCAEAFRKSLLLDPDNLVALRTKGNAHFALKQYDLALTDYLRIAALDPSIETIHYGIGTLLLKLGRPGEALAAFELALEIDPSYGEAAEAVADLRGKLG